MRAIYTLDPQTNGFDRFIGFGYSEHGYELADFPNSLPCGLVVATDAPRATCLGKSSNRENDAYNKILTTIKNQDEMRKSLFEKTKKCNQLLRSREWRCVYNLPGKSNSFFPMPFSTIYVSTDF